VALLAPGEQPLTKARGWESLLDLLANALGPSSPPREVGVDVVPMSQLVRDDRVHVNERH
jgi:hypothetical protein